LNEHHKKKKSTAVMTQENTKDYPLLLLQTLWRMTFCMLKASPLFAQGEKEISRFLRVSWKNNDNSRVQGNKT
jgi:hypothetical protein